MPRLRIFLSSTYLDNREVRNRIASFLKKSDCEPVMFERGGVYYDPHASVGDSCQSEVKQCHLVVCIVGSRYGAPVSDRETSKAYISYTLAECEAAMKAGIQVWTFVKRDVLVEYATYQRNKKHGTELAVTQVDSPQVYELIAKLRSIKSGMPLLAYDTADDIARALRKQFSGFIRKGLSRAKMGSARVKVNAYKLFYHRRQVKLSLSGLARKARISEAELRRIENSPKGKLGLGEGQFRSLDIVLLSRLEKCLGCQGLGIGKLDDYRSAYLEYYFHYKIRHRRSANGGAGEDSLFPVKVAVFDFDGTLTMREDDFNSWECLWITLGRSVQECSTHLNRYRMGDITHEEWCKITRDSFVRAGMSRKHLDGVARRIKLLPGTRELLAALKEAGVVCYIVSGSIKTLISGVMGDLYEYFSGVEANDMLFGRVDELVDIRGTAFDFEGKARFIRSLMEKHRVAPLEVLFVGNSMNDVYVSNSGARTLCINPRFTDPTDKSAWSQWLRHVTNLVEILPYFRLSKDVRTEEYSESGEDKAGASDGIV